MEDRKLKVGDLVQWAKKGKKPYFISLITSHYKEDDTVDMLVLYDNREKEVRYSVGGIITRYPAEIFRSEIYDVTIT